jgi:hypothetical protein
MLIGAIFPRVCGLCGLFVDTYRALGSEAKSSQFSDGAMPIHWLMYGPLQHYPDHITAVNTPVLMGARDPLNSSNFRRTATQNVWVRVGLLPSVTNFNYAPH